MSIEKACECFGDCKEKYVRGFDEYTPQNNHIKGYICRKPNRFLGSLYITEINGEKTEQFVQSMPKIKYFEHENDININGDIVAFEKLDGSCLILYPIFDSKGEIIEIVPKTRGRAVADKHFIDLYNKIPHKSIEKYYELNKGVLIFELYGILNQHEIIHYQTGVDIALIGVYNNGHFYKGKSLMVLAKAYGFHTPDPVFKVKYRNGMWRVLFNSKKYKMYDIGYVKAEPTRMDALDYIQKELEKLNKIFLEENGRIATEGVVINCSNWNGVQKYIKCKPRDIENKHRNNGGIPRSSITKEVLKYFDEYGSMVAEIYQEDKNHHTEYIHRMLREDYEEEWIKNSSKKIEKVFMQIWESKQVPQSIHEICNDLVTEFGDKGITHCMRMFGQKYPMKKQYASTVYGVLKVKGVE